MPFDDARLEDPDALAAADEQLRWLALTGARIRAASTDVNGSRSARRLLAGFDAAQRPRGIVAVGSEARLVRAVLEPVCPVPFVAWPFDGLPGWVGPLDLVIVLASQGSRPGLMTAVAEATRRGATAIVAAEPGSPIADQGASRTSLVLPVPGGDALATAVAVLDGLNALGLGPDVDPESVAAAVDRVAERCSPHVDLASNPAKEIALWLAEATPLVWGGSVLAGRASRRIAEALRRVSGRPALAADASDLEPVLAQAGAHDTFADPFADPADGSAVRPALVVLNDVAPDAQPDATVRQDRAALVAEAQRREVRVCEVDAGTTPNRPVDAYASLLAQGLYGAAYLGIGLAE